MQGQSARQQTSPTRPKSHGIGSALSLGTWGRVRVRVRVSVRVRDRVRVRIGWLSLGTWGRG